MHFLIIILLLSTTSFTHGKIFTNCELVKELSKYIPKDEVHTHLCVTARDTSRQIGGYYGIYKINTCGVLKKGGICGIRCEKLIDENISDDIECAKLIFKSNKLRKASKIKIKCDSKKKIVDDCLVQNRKPIFIAEEDASGDGEGSGFSMGKSLTFFDDEDFLTESDSGSNLQTNSQANLTSTSPTTLENSSSIYFASQNASSETKLCNNPKNDSTFRCFTQPLNIMLIILLGLTLMIFVIFFMKWNIIMAGCKKKITTEVLSPASD